MKRIPLRLAVALTGAACISLPAQASSYPEKAIVMVVPYSPGGGVDIITRLIAQPMAQVLKQSIVVDNKPGGGTNIGMSTVARSTADGYTVLTSSNTLTTNKALYAKLNYDPVADLVPVARIGEAPLVVVVNAKSPFQNLADLLNAGKAKPDSLSFGTAGVGSSGHMASELLIRAGGVKAVHVPYKGGSAAVTDLLGGRLDFMAINPLEVVPHVQNGTLRALAMLNQKGSHLLPEVKTARALGYDVEATVWWGLNVPKGTPDAVIATLNKALNSALATPDVQKKLSDIGASPVGGTSEDFRKFIAKESASLSELIKAANIQAD